MRRRRIGAFAQKERDGRSRPNPSTSKEDRSQSLEQTPRCGRRLALPRTVPDLSVGGEGVLRRVALLGDDRGLRLAVDGALDRELGGLVVVLLDLGVVGRF